MDLVESRYEMLVIYLVVYLHLDWDHDEWNGFAAGNDEVVDGFFKVLWLSVGYDHTHFVEHVVVEGFVIDEFYDFRVVGRARKLKVR